MYDRVMTVVVMIVAFLFSDGVSSWAQTVPWRFPTSADGDTISSSLSLPDSVFVHNEIVFRIKDQTLNTNALCSSFDWVDATMDKSDNEAHSNGVMDWTLRSHVMSEQLDLSDVINDTALVAYLQTRGGLYFTRIMASSPCAPHTSITRTGDTLISGDHQFYLLHLNNDTSVAQVVLEITLNPTLRTLVHYVQPNYKFDLSRNPADPLYQPDQLALQQQHSNVARLWDWWHGLPSTLVSVVDDGVKYEHCEFGPNGIGNLGDKVVDGFSYPFINKNFHHTSVHGTAVASIIGAYTNRFTCGVDVPQGMAGIAGGWGPQSNSPDLGGGVKLLGLKCSGLEQYNVITTTSIVIAALRESVGDKETDYSKYHNAWAADIVMNSYNMIGSGKFDAALWDAVMYVFEHGVPMIVPSTNTSDDTRRFPTIYSDQTTITIGASDKSNNRISYSNYQKYLDIIAPGGVADTPDNLNIGASAYNPANYPLWRDFQGTSAAAPNAAGVIAAIHGNILIQNTGRPLSPEDYEGLLQATARDRTPTDQPSANDQALYMVGADSRTGWGLLDAGQIVENHESGYVLKHYDLDVDDAYVDWGGWSDEEIWQFSTYEGRRGKLPNSGTYVGRVRSVVADFTLPGNWNRDYPLYVWGRGGQPNNGYDVANPNHGQGVTEGDYFGYQLNGNGVDEGNKVRDGNIIRLRTWQFHLKDLSLNDIGHYPADDKIKFSVTLYGVPAVATSMEEEYVAKGQDLCVVPNPSTRSSVEIRGNSVIAGKRLLIVSQHGEIAIDVIIDNMHLNSYIVPADILAAGVYSVIVMGSGSFSTTRFVTY